jgi:hypothetical protein
MELKDLKKKIPYKWRVQSFSKNKPSASCVAYIDARDVMDLLDDVVGAENWQDKYELVGNRLICGIGIRATNGEWIWKYDTGTESPTESEKGQFSDAFKRAAVKWGVGRFLYDLTIQYVTANEKMTEANKRNLYVVDDGGKRVWDITKHIENKLKPKYPEEIL